MGDDAEDGGPRASGGLIRVAPVTPRLADLYYVNCIQVEYTTTIESMYVQFYVQFI